MSNNPKPSFTDEIKGGNQLFPVFLRMDRLNLLVVGAGAVGWEKLSYMFRHCQDVKNIRVVAPEIKEEIFTLVESYPSIIKLRKGVFEVSDLKGIDLVLLATNNVETNREIYEIAKRAGKLVNVADTPDLCDFYLSSVVKKGDLKIAISSNGKSPTLTKRIREMLTEALPEEVDELLQNLEQIRNGLKGDFEDKVNKLNEITSEMKISK